MKAIEIHGHRGCRGLLPENTIPAFQRAIDLGVDVLEMDIAVTKNHEIIISHEPFMSRKICLDPKENEIPLEDDMKHNLYKLSYDDIKKFDCGLKFHPDFPNQQKLKVNKPLLSEVFDCIEKISTDIKYNIEIKAKPEYDNVYTPEPETFVKLVLKTIKDYDVFQRCNLQSFDLRILEEINKQEPHMKVALLIDKDESIASKLNKLSFKPNIISPYYELLHSKEQLQGLQSEGFKVIPWTVNHAEDMKRLIFLNVDGIITDYPDRLINFSK